MNRIGVVGVDWRAGGPDLLAEFTLPPEERPLLLQRLRRRLPAREVVYLATCNRVEVAFVAERGQPIGAYRERVFRELRGRDPQPSELREQLRAWGGEGAAEHLFRLASGLESAVVGEREIVGQMRAAVEAAREAGTCGRVLGWLFEQSFLVARRVHAATALGDGKVSVAELALDRLRERLQRAAGTVALVGVSPMTIRCGRALAEEGIPVRFYNRTLERARAAAAEIGGSGHALAELFAAPPADLAAVLCATAAPTPILGRPEIEKLAAACSQGGTPLLLDLATPPDVDPAAAEMVGLPRVGMSELLAEVEAHREARLRKGRAAALLVEQALEGLDARLAEELLAPLLAALQRRYRATADAGVERLLRRELRELSAAQRERLARWAAVLARRFAHLPTVGLRALAREHGFDAVESFVRAADPDLAGALRVHEPDAPAAHEEAEPAAEAAAPGSGGGPR